MTRFWLGIAVSVVVAGCSVRTTSPMERTDFEPSDPAAVSTGMGGAAVLHDPSLVTKGEGRSELGRGTLSDGEGCPENDWEKCQVSPARPSICISVDGRGEIESIDGLECRIATEMHDCSPQGCPWLECGGCLFHVDARGEHLERSTERAGPPWRLSGLGGEAACAAFQGSYAIYADPECASRPGE